MSKDFVSPPHPGEILREDLLPRLGMSRTAFARHLGISAGRLGAVLSERSSVTLDLAVRLAAAFGHGSRYWLGLQAQHDIWRAEQVLASVTVKPVVWPQRSTQRRSMQTQARAG